MSDNVIIKTRLENPPEELVYCWREPYERFPVKDRVVTGLSLDHPRFAVLQYEWKLEVTEVAAGKKPLSPVESVKGSPPPVTDVKKESLQAEVLEDKEA